MADDDDRKLFEDALASLSAREVFTGKYGKPGDEVDADASDPDEAMSREEVARLRELREMESAFHGVERMDGGKFYVPQPQGLDEDDEDELRAEFAAALAKPTGDAATPATEARRSLAESAPDDVHTLNLRGFEPDTAIVKLGLFVDLASKDDHQLIRLRIGSNGPLLQAVQEWFRGPGVVYLLEVEISQQHGDAAVFARIRRMNPS